jgi:hypothetical protein
VERNDQFAGFDPVAIIIGNHASILRRGQGDIKVAFTIEVLPVVNKSLYSDVGKRLKLAFNLLNLVVEARRVCVKRLLSGDHEVGTKLPNQRLIGRDALDECGELRR